MTIATPCYVCVSRSPAACDRLVEAGALAQLFAIFMGRSKIKNSKGEAGDKDVLREVEERCVSIISNLFQVMTWGREVGGDQWDREVDPGFVGLRLGHIFFLQQAPAAVTVSDICTCGLHHTLPGDT